MVCRQNHLASTVASRCPLVLAATATGKRESEMNTYEPNLEVQLTLSELRAVVKSLAIGVDQLAKKAMRMHGSKRTNSVQEELELLISAKSEMEDVLSAALGGRG